MKTRTYSSPLRDRNVAQTRERILDAVVRVLARGPAELSVPAVAELAGVSVPTVYRHFGSKRGLVDALYARYTSAIGTDWSDNDVLSVETFLERLPEVFRRHDKVDPVLRAAMSGSVARKIRRNTMPARASAVERAIRSSAPHLSDEDRERLSDLFIVLASSATQRAFRDYLGLSPNEAAERVDWAMRRLIGSPRGRRRQKHA